MKHDFVRVGELVINLAAITTIQPQKWDGRECIRIEFIGGTVERIYRGKPGYDELLARIGTIGLELEIDPAKWFGQPDEGDER